MIKNTPPTFAESEFRKASTSHPDRECVRVAWRDGWAELRDDKTPFGAANDHRITLTSEQFETIQTDLRTGNTPPQHLDIINHTNGTYTFRNTTPPHHANPNAELTFTEAEFAAFLHGITRHEFDTTTA